MNSSTPDADMTVTDDTYRRQPVLAALDIDGTIAVPGTIEISVAVRAAVARCVADGHPVVLASGRSLVGVLLVARVLGLAESWIVASNGAVTARLDSAASSGYVLENTQSFSVEPVVRLARNAVPGVQIGVERIGWGYHVTHLFAPSEVNGAQKIVSSEDLWNQPTTRLILRGPGVLDLLVPLRAAGVTATPAASDWVDVTAPGLSKATALEKVRANLGVDPTRTVAVGDAHNDIDMLRWAACGTAMGHAVAVVREAADCVTGALDQDGAAAVLDALHTGAMP